MNITVVTVALGVCAGVALPQESRFTLSMNEDRVKKLIEDAINPLQQEITSLRGAKTAEPPRFQQTSSTAKDWEGMGVPKQLIKSLEDLVKSFDARKSPSGGSIAPGAPGSTEHVANMIETALQNGPPMQPELMMKMFDAWDAQRNAMRYVAETQPAWFQNYQPPNPQGGYPGPAVPVAAPPVAQMAMQPGPLVPVVPSEMRERMPMRDYGSVYSQSLPPHSFHTINQGVLTNV